MLHRSITALLLIGLACFFSSSLHAQEEEAADNTAEVVNEDDAQEDDAQSEDAQEEAHEHDTADHGRHDTDPTHANLSDDGPNIIEFRNDMALFTAVVFALLMAGLLTFAWKPIMAGLEKREQRIAGNIQKAEQDAASAAAKLAEYNAQLATAAAEAQRIVTEARKDAEATGQKLIAAAQDESTRLQERAAVEIESAKRLATNELASQSTNLAMLIAGRVVSREVNADDHNGLIQEMLAKLPSNN